MLWWQVAAIGLGLLIAALLIFPIIAYELGFSAAKKEAELSRIHRRMNELDARIRKWEEDESQ